MLTVDLDIQDRLINDQTGNISLMEFGRRRAQKVYVKFPDEQAALKAMRCSHLVRQSSLVPIEKCEAGISKKKGSASPSIKRTQFPLILAWTFTVHKVQGLSLEQGVIYFDLQKKIIWTGQIYTAFSSVKTYDNLYCIGEIKRSAI